MRWASSQMTRSQSGAASSFAFSSSERAAMSSRTISRFFSTNGLPVTEASIWSRVRMSKCEAELLGHLVLPLLDQAAGRDDQAALEVAADQQLLDQQPRHDRLAGAGIVGEQEAQRLARQHLAVDGRDLVRQRLDLRRADGEIGIEQVGEPDAVGLRRQPQQAAVGVEGVGPPGLDELEAAFLAAIDQPLADPAVDPEHEVQGVRAEARDLNDLGDPGGVEAPQSRAGLDILEVEHSPPIGPKGLYPVQATPAASTTAAAPLPLDRDRHRLGLRHQHHQLPAAGHAGVEQVPPAASGSAGS